MDEPGADQNVAKTYDTTKVMERNLKLRRSLYLDLQGVMIQAEVCSLSHDEQRV
jgi:hypothetical protein